MFPNLNTETNLQILGNLASLNRELKFYEPDPYISGESKIRYNGKVETKSMTNHP